MLSSQIAIAARRRAAAAAFTGNEAGTDGHRCEQQQQHLLAADRLLGALYTAFQRSLLLLNLESQVRLEELPWYAALQATVLAKDGQLDGKTTESGSNSCAAAECRTDSLQLLRHVSLLYMRYFPGTLLPNKLVRELSSLGTAAGFSYTQLPFVYELAADIFIDVFGPQFVRSGHLAAKLLEDSLYEAYYNINYSHILQLEVGTGTDSQQQPDAFSAVCRSRAEGAGESNGAGSWVAQNGRIVEQGQVLTTHNLATLVVVLELQQEVEQQAQLLAGSAWQTFLGEVLRARDASSWRQKLQGVKNAAYAWRNLLFYLSLLPPGPAGPQAEFVRGIQQQLSERQPPLDPAALDVLLRAVDGLGKAQEEVAARAAARSGAGSQQRDSELCKRKAAEPAVTPQVLGWVCGEQHWLLK